MLKTEAETNIEHPHPQTAEEGIREEGNQESREKGALHYQAPGLDGLTGPVERQPAPATPT
jgi:hypothetical protein